MHRSEWSRHSGQSLNMAPQYESIKTFHQFSRQVKDLVDMLLIHVVMKTCFYVSIQNDQSNIFLGLPNYTFSGQEWLSFTSQCLYILNLYFIIIPTSQFMGWLGYILACKQLSCTNILINSINRTSDGVCLFRKQYLCLSSPKYVNKNLINHNRLHWILRRNFRKKCEKTSKEDFKTWYQNRHFIW